MSTATELTRIQNAKAAIRTSIENKGVTVPASDLIDTYAGYVDQIPTGGGSQVTEKDVNFYDWDGTLLYSYTLAEAHALQALPELPGPYKDYTASSWTESLSFINNLTYPWMVGVNYTTERTATKVYITVPEPDTDLGEDTSVYFRAEWNALNVDWGDGTTETVSYQADTVHSYAAAGDYVISVVASNSDYTILGMVYNKAPMIMSSRYHNLYTQGQTGTNSEPVADFLVTMVELGANTTLTLSAFMPQMGLKKIILPNTFRISNYAPFKNTGLRFISLPSAYSRNIAQIFGNCGALEKAILPSSWFINCDYYVYNGTYTGCCSLRKINWPHTLLAPLSQSNTNACLYYCWSLEQDIVIPTGLTQLTDSFWAQTSGNGAGFGTYKILNTAEITVLGSNAFQSWKGSSTVWEFSPNISNIGNLCFGGSNFRTFIFRGTTPPTIYNDRVFSGSSRQYLIRIYVPYGYKAAYVGASSAWAALEPYIYELPQA